MKFENTKVYGFEHAFRGMRNPKNSWDKSDSFFGLIDISSSQADYDITEKWLKKEYPPDMNLYLEAENNNKINDRFEEIDQWLIKNGTLQTDVAEYSDLAEVAFIGPDDMKLAQTLIKAGSEHRKFLRQIFVSIDITAPIYWWKEFDTYKVGTVANSTSTMHKLASTPITLDCFEIDDLNDENMRIGNYDCLKYMYNQIINNCESLRQLYLKTKDKKYWKELIRWLPESWLQTRTVTMNYENLFAICSKGQRRFHKLNEWSGIDNPELNNFISWARTLPYAQELIFIDELSDADDITEKAKIVKVFDTIIDALHKINANINNMNTEDILNEIINALNL